MSVGTGSIKRAAKTVAPVKAEPVKKAEPAKKAEPVKKAEPAKKAAPVKKAAPSKKAAPKKASTVTKSVKDKAEFTLTGQKCYGIADEMPVWML